MKYYIIAGEASGDLHGSNLIKALKAKDAQATFRCWGGSKMEDAGAEVVMHFKDLSYMGFWEVATNIHKILGNFKFCKQDILKYQPEVVILIDYPGFNLRMLKFLKSNGFKTVYYISPQLWAWNSSRVKLIKKHVDLLLVILPFEKDFYKSYGVEAHFTGHPLLDELPEPDFSIKIENKKVALLPGSRAFEIKNTLPLMLTIARQNSNYTFTVAGMEHIGMALYDEIIGELPIEIIMNNTREVLQTAGAAIVTSGTATLETALIGVPQVVVYKGSQVSYFIGKMLVKVPYISLVNLILDKKVVEELIQSDYNRENLNQAFGEILKLDKRKIIIESYKELHQKLGGKGASENAAGKIIEMVKGEFVKF